MFSVNDHVVFGNHGICVIKAIGPLDLSIAERGRLYYTLEPLYAQKNTIYTPVDNEKSSLRRAITREEALELIDRIPQVETVWVLDEKRREEKYKEIMKQNDCMGWMQIIKTLYLKKQKRLAEGRKNTARDELYLKLAEDFLYGEFAAALDVEKGEVEDLIGRRVREMEMCL